MSSVSVCDAGDAVASSTAEISVVTLRVNDPVIPTDRRKVNVKRISAAFTRVWAAVDASLFTTHSVSAWKSVDDDERLVIVVT